MKKMLLVLITLTLYACESTELSINDINFSNSSHQFDIIVDCYITTELKKHYIKLAKPSDDILDKQDYPISDANVYISDGNYKYVFIESETEGIYESIMEFSSHAGTKYNLHLKAGDKEYYASDTPVAVSDINFSQIQLPERDYSFISSTQIILSGYRHLFGYAEINKWLWLSNNKLRYYLQPFSEELKFSYTHSRTEVKGLFPNDKIGYGIQGAIEDTITVVKYSISDDYYKYLLALFSETEWKAGLFSSISGNLPTNLSQGATGYFYIMDIDVKKITISELLK